MEHIQTGLFFSIERFFGISLRNFPRQMRPVFLPRGKGKEIEISFMSKVAVYKIAVYTIIYKQDPIFFLLDANNNSLKLSCVTYKFSRYLQCNNLFKIDLLCLFISSSFRECFINGIFHWLHFCTHKEFFLFLPLCVKVKLVHTDCIKCMSLEKSITIHIPTCQ